MNPWWRRHRETTKVCRSCHGNEEVHDGLCRHCRRALLNEETPRPVTVTPEKPEHMPSRPPVEPPHDRPWVHRGGA